MKRSATRSPRLAAVPGSRLAAAPAKRAPAPRYPTKLAVNARPALLRRHIPPGWQRGPLAAVTGSLLAAATGCGSDQVAGSGTGKVLVPRVPTVMMGTPAPVPASGPLPEEEALRIIRTEFAKVDIRFTERDFALPGTRVDGYRPEQFYHWTSKTLELGYTPVSGPFVADLYAPEHRITVEVIGDGEYLTLGGEPGKEFGYARNEAAETDLARRLTEQIRGQATSVRFAALAPAQMSRDEAISIERRKGMDLRNQSAVTQPVPELHGKASDQLREQVRTFIEWLKAQGAI